MDHKYYDLIPYIFMFGFFKFIYSTYIFIKWHEFIEINNNYENKKYKINLKKLQENKKYIHKKLLNIIPNFTNFEVKYNFSIFNLTCEIKNNIEPYTIICTKGLTINNLLEIKNISTSDYIYIDDILLKLFPEEIKKIANINYKNNNSNNEIAIDIKSKSIDPNDIENNSYFFIEIDENNNWNIINNEDL
jgi:hypothetical protein